MPVTLSSLYGPGLSTNGQPVPAPVPTQTPPQYLTYNPNANNGSLSRGVIQSVNTNPMTSGQVLGASTSRLSAPSAPPAPTGPDLSSLQTQYDMNMSDLKGQLDQVGQQRDSALSGLQNQQNQLLSDVGNQKTDVMNQKDTAIGQAADTARGTQMQNRNILRSLGILNSSYAADKLQQPNNLFDTARANIVQQAQQRVGQLDDFINNKKAEFVNTYGQLQNQFANLVGQIQHDMTFTDRQRADAVNAANSAYQQQLQNLHNGTQNLLQQAEAARQNFVAANLTNAIGQNPDLLSNLGQLQQYQQSLNTAGSSFYGGPTASIYQDPNQKKNTLSGQ